MLLLLRKKKRMADTPCSWTFWEVMSHQGPSMSWVRYTSFFSSLFLLLFSHLFFFSSSLSFDGNEHAYHTQHPLTLHFIACIHKNSRGNDSGHQQSSIGDLNYSHCASLSLLCGTEEEEKLWNCKGGNCYGVCCCRCW